MTREVRHQHEVGERLVTRAKIAQGGKGRPVGPIGLSVATVDELLDANGHSFARRLQSASEGGQADFVLQEVRSRPPQPDPADPSNTPTIILISILLTHVYWLRDEH